MLERDTDLLDGLLDDEYTLAHLTGYLQSKREWLEQIWGSRGTWNLQLSTTYERRNGEWIALKTVATTC
jgi:hypothetical protein